MLLAIRHKPFAICHLLFAICYLLSGCASVPRYEAGIPVYNINGIKYVSLISLCDSYQISWDYDPFTRTVTLKKDIYEVNLLLGDSLALVNGIPRDLKHPVEIHNGEIVVPYRFKRDIVNLILPLYLKQKPPLPHIKEINRIVIDPGHGGKDPGAIGRGGLKEKIVCLDIAQRLKPILESWGFEVLLTREGDEFVSLSERANFANRNKADLFISIHANANRARWMTGFEVYYVSESVNDSARAMVSAENHGLGLEGSHPEVQTLNIKTTVWDIIYTHNRAESAELAAHICQSISKSMSTKVLGVKAAPFYVLKWTHMPSVLVEVGFISNSYEEQLLQRGFYRQQIAEAIAGGIYNYCQEYKIILTSHR